MRGFHHSVAVLQLPFCRSAVVKFRCSVKITQENSVPLGIFATATVYTETANGNGKAATEERQRNSGNRALFLACWSAQLRL